MLRLKLVGLVGCACAVGCAPALSSFTPAHVAPHKHVQAEAGFDVSVPTGSIIDVVSEGKDLAVAAHDHDLTDEEQQRLFRAGAALALNPPSLVYHLGAAYGLLDNFEVGGRLTSGAWRLGARYQFFDQGQHGVDGTFGLGGGHYSFEFPLSGEIPLLKLEDFSRWQLDASFLIGKKGSWYRWWAGPRLMMSFYSSRLEFDQPAIGGSNAEQHVLAAVDGRGTYLGGQAGAAFGYKHVFLGFELTLAEFWTSANMTLIDRKHDSDLHSFIVYPGLALLFEI